MQSYHEFREWSQEHPRASKLGNNTYLERGENCLGVRLHSTTIVKFHLDGWITLDSGGWRTVTTKARFREFLPSGWSVWSERGVWFLHAPNGESYPYDDGMRFHPETGQVEGQGEDPRAQLKLRAQVKRFSGEFIKALEAGKVPAPSGGDCWFCHFGFGESDTSHLIEHMRERYFVPSLLARAVDERSDKVSKVALWTLQQKWNGEDANGWGGHGFVQLRKALQAYMMDRFDGRPLAKAS